MSAGETGEASVRLTALVSVDVAETPSSDERLEELEHEAGLLHHRLEAAAEACGGGVVDDTGAGVLFAFASAGAALAAIHDFLDNPGADEPAIRVGAHVGDAVIGADGIVSGASADVARRLQEMAAPGAALVSGEFRSLAEASPRAARVDGKVGAASARHVQTFEILSQRSRARLFWRRVFIGAAGAAAVLVLWFLAPLVLRSLSHGVHSPLN